MKKIVLAVAAVGLLMATPSCKKGENDPFLSLKSRKSRLAGEYTMASWYMNSDTEYTNSSEKMTLDINDGSGSRTIIYDSDSGDPTTTVAAVTVNSEEFVVEKDGTWSRKMVITYKYTRDGDGFFVDDRDYVDVVTSEETGTWSFLGGQSEDYKNKERVLLSVTKSDVAVEQEITINYTDGTSGTVNESSTDNEEFAEGVNSIIYTIDMLKSKEMVFKQDLNEGYDYEEVTDDVVYEGSMTKVGETEIKFVQE
ncbi:hypothetical protein [Crocinitomix algicola]|uniref:hypothetical protein n=1 Tax=Crocinitomix algicola TaxID=1740263 RepID=UPI00082EC49D|nr:hypothetical protein [Crocinitomix algicola]